LQALFLPVDALSGWVAAMFAGTVATLIMLINRKGLRKGRCVGFVLNLALEKTVFKAQMKTGQSATVRAWPVFVSF